QCLLITVGRSQWKNAHSGKSLLYYHRLRVGGLILAAVLCLIGITILFSGHCRCVMLCTGTVIFNPQNI
uniref:FXYD domain-containing ion transport regulator n=1 Tax=Mola mola TaxID=94237 RepID=A0A3Q3VZ46_MOLML